MLFAREAVFFLSGACSALACATPAAIPPQVRLVNGPTLASDAPQATDIEMQQAVADFASGRVELTSPRAGGFRVRIHLVQPASGTTYELGSGNVTGECEVQGKVTPLSGVVRVDEWTPIDGTAEISADVWCTPAGFEQPHRIRVAFIQRRPAPAQSRDELPVY